MSVKGSGSSLKSEINFAGVAVDGAFAASELVGDQAGRRVLAGQRPQLPIIGSRPMLVVVGGVVAKINSLRSAAGSETGR